MLSLIRPIQTVDGRAVRLISSTLRGQFPIAYTVEDDVLDTVIRANLEGKDARGRVLIQNPPELYYVNIYRKPDGRPYVGQPKSTEREAIDSLERNDRASTNVYVKTIPISI